LGRSAAVKKKGLFSYNFINRRLCSAASDIRTIVNDEFGMM